MSCKLSVSCCFLIFLFLCLNVTKLLASRPVGNAKIFFAYQGRVFEYPKDKKLLKQMFGKKGWPKSVVKQVYRYTGTQEFKDFVKDMSAGDVKVIPNFRINYGSNKNPQPGEFIFAPKTGDQESRWVQLKKNESLEDFCRSRLFGKNHDEKLTADEQRQLQKYQRKMRNKNPGRFAAEPTKNTIDIASNRQGDDKYFNIDSRWLGGLARSWYESSHGLDKGDFGNDGVLERDEVTTPQTAFTSGFGSFMQSVFDKDHRNNLFSGIHDLKTEMNNSTADDSRYTSIENPTLQDYLSTEQVNASIVNGIWANQSRHNELRSALSELDGNDNSITDFLRKYAEKNGGDVPRAASIFDVSTNFTGKKRDIKEIFGSDCKPYLKERKERQRLWEQCKENGISYEQFVNAINGQNGQTLDQLSQQFQMAENGKQSGKPLEGLQVLGVSAPTDNNTLPPMVIQVQGDKENQPAQPEQPAEVQPTTQTQPTCQPTYCQPNYNNCQRSCSGYRSPGYVRGQPLRNVGRFIFRRRRW